MKRSALPSVSFLVVAEVIALFTAGLEDQGAFLFWTLPSALLAGVFAAGLSGWSKDWNKIVSYGTSVVCGAILGLLWTYTVALFLGPWVGAFGAPILLCWVAGGASAAVAAQCFRDYKPARSIPTVLAVSTVVSLAVFLIPLAVRKAANDQELLTFVFRYTPGTESLRISHDPSSWSHDQRLSDEEEETLRERYETGRLELEARHKHGAGAASRAILVVQRPVNGGLKLAQPDQETIFYFQTSTGFESYPESVACLDRFITLSSRQYEWEGTAYMALSYMIDSWDGSATGSDVMRWEKANIEPDSSANGSQPIRSETNRRSSAAGSRR